METTYIYTLSCPETLAVRYIGKANNPKTRLSAHLSPKSIAKNTYSARWINSLVKKGLKPVLNIIEQVDFDKWQEAETKWINHYKGLGCKLCNLTDGGEGLVNPSEETKEKQRANNKRNIAVYQTPEFREKISKASKAMIRTPEHCRKISESKIGKKRSPETIKKMSEGRKGIVAMSKEQYAEIAKITAPFLKTANEKRKKTVGLFNADNVMIEQYESLADAAKKNNILKGVISNSIKRNGKLRSGLFFRYL
jgi:group I intron endonuclease